MAISVPTSIFDTYYEAVDYMIETLFPTNCRIYYPALKVECENCYFNTLPGVGATNRYRPGGPAPFEDGACPYCNGLGHKMTVTTASIKVRAYFDAKTWTKFNPKIAFKTGSVMIIGYMNDVPKLQHMAYIQLQTDIEGINNYKFELGKDPVPWGFNNKCRYFTTNLERINGDS